jgi:hypothetical protein
MATCGYRDIAEFNRRRADGRRPAYEGKPLQREHRSDGRARRRRVCRDTGALPDGGHAGSSDAGGRSRRAPRRRRASGASAPGSAGADRRLPGRGSACRRSSPSEELAWRARARLGRRGARLRRASTPQSDRPRPCASAGVFTELLPHPRRGRTRSGAETQGLILSGGPGLVYSRRAASPRSAAARARDPGAGHLPTACRRWCSSSAPSVEPPTVGRVRTLEPDRA